MRRVLQVVDVLSFSALVIGLWFVSPWLVLAAAGVGGLLLVNRLERVQ